MALGIESKIPRISTGTRVRCQSRAIKIQSQADNPSLLVEFLEESF